MIADDLSLWTIPTDAYLRLRGPRGGVTHVRLTPAAERQAVGLTALPPVKTALVAAWDFIENVTDADPERSDKFFALRELVREALTAAEGRRP